MRRYLLTLSLIVGFFALFMLPASSSAEPILQLYIEGATYDLDSETWISEYTGDPIRLWAIGNISGGGGKGVIEDVRLSAAYSNTSGGVGISLTPSTTAGYGGFTDPSTPSGTGTYIQTVTDGSSPILGTGESLPSHGVYGAGIYWQEFSMGDFAVADSPLGDFINSFPSPSSSNYAQINVYNVTFSGLAVGDSVHFDLYDHYYNNQGDAKVKFAPFSHDASTGTVPEPGTLTLLGTGLVGLALLGRKGFRR